VLDEDELEGLKEKLRFSGKVAAPSLSIGRQSRRDEGPPEDMRGAGRWIECGTIVPSFDAVVAVTTTKINRSRFEEEYIKDQPQELVRVCAQSQNFIRCLNQRQVPPTRDFVISPSSASFEPRPAPKYFKRDSILP
jgi:hypothetical protein